MRKIRILQCWPLVNYENKNGGNMLGCCFDITAWFRNGCGVWASWGHSGLLLGPGFKI
jgi:hypothetical protein